jgi:hypothetical protein
MMSVDPKSYELAEHFLADDDVRDLTPAQVKQRTMSLAQAIQRAVEDWCDDEARAADEAAAKDAELRSLKGLTDEQKARI